MAYAARVDQRLPKNAPSASKSQPDVRVIRGRRTSDSSQVQRSIASVIKGLFIFILAALIVGFIRIAFISATVSTSLTSGAISEQIEQLRASSSDLEVKQSSLTNPQAIKRKALSMGMALPGQTQVVTLPADVIVTNEKGALSLSAGLAVAAQQQG